MTTIVGRSEAQMEKVLKTPQDYAEALARLHALLDERPEAGSPTAARVELLALLIANYEREKFEHLPAPTPIEAIRFRMEQMDLTQKDLVRYLGSASRVSEVLSGKRPLTLPMIRALSGGLGIPAELLIKENHERETSADLDWARFPVSEIVDRGWLGQAPRKVGPALQAFISPVLAHSAAFRRTSSLHAARNVDQYALLAWLARVWHRADEELRGFKDTKSAVSVELVRDVIRLSWSDQGPLLALDLLKRHGLPIVVEPPLPRTFLDGATILRPEGPVIGLTLRFDRLDSFWYTLVHELAHVLLHGDRSRLFVDDFETGFTDEIEAEADAFAVEALIPQEAWRSSPASRLRSRQAAEHLARQLRISPAIVAGRVRREYKDYRVLGELVGHRSVRKLFPALQWKET